MRKSILSDSKFAALIMALGLFMLTGCVASQSGGGVSGSAAGSNASGTQVENVANH